MKHIILLVFTHCYFFIILGQQLAKPTPVNYRMLVSSADLVYNKPVTRSEAGQPIGNGKMGTLIWTTPQSLRFQINRVDIFGNGSGTNNFFQRHTDYCGGAGFVDIDFQGIEPIFTEKTFNQHLSCYDGIVTTEGDDVITTTLISNEADVMAIKIMDFRNNKTPIVGKLRTLRHPEMYRGDHSAISKVKIIGEKIILTQEFREGEYYNSSAVVLSMAGSKVDAWIENDTEVKLSTNEVKQEYFIYVASASSFDPDEDIVEKALDQLRIIESKTYQETEIECKKWWHSYWERSYVDLNSADGKADFVEKYYIYYLYLMGATSRGDFPVKFNGMLWTTGGDKRQWGGMYWGANQSCLYDALLTANRMDLMDPMFNMYYNMRESFEKASSKIFKSKGMWIPETIGFDGLPDIPDDIATQMSQLFLQNSPLISSTKEFNDFLSYASTKIPHHSFWNWKADIGWKDGKWNFKDKGHGFTGHVVHIFSRGAKLAYLYWMKYEHTQDKEWLKQYAYPMIKGIAEFYRNYPNIREGSNGKYNIYHVNDNESVWGGINTAEEMSAMKGIFPVAIKASEILDLDSELRTYWKDFLKKLAPLSLSSDHQEMGMQPTTFVRSLKPVLKGPATGRPDSNTMPQWCFDFITLESQDEELMQIANNTYEAYFPQGINDSTNIGILSMLPVAGTLLGKKEVTEFLIPNQIRMGGNGEMENRMHLREGPQTTTAQRLGRAAHALHNALCQSIPSAPGEQSTIHVFPAWPVHWNAQFKLHARGNFLVTSSFQNGEVEYVEIESRSGVLCRIRNPWKGNVILYVDGRKEQILNGSLLKFSTKAGSKYLIIKEK